MHVDWKAWWHREQKDTPVFKKNMKLAVITLFSISVFLGCLRLVNC